MRQSRQHEIPHSAPRLHATPRAHGVFTVSRCLYHPGVPTSLHTRRRIVFSRETSSSHLICSEWVWRGRASLPCSEGQTSSVGRTLRAVTISS
eukprot:3327614-Pleurochrysis_carterae.AAC.1